MDRQAWNRRYAAEALIWTAAPNPLLAAEAGRLRPARALDLGTGEGRNAIWLAERGWRVTAVDFSEVALAKARRLARRHRVRVRWLAADVTEYRPRHGYYQLVLLCYLQLPPTERRRVLRAAAAAVAPRGTLLYIGHDRSNLEHGAGGPRDPAVLCRPQDIVADLPAFAIVRAEVVKRRVSSDPGHGGPASAMALDALVRARRQRRRETSHD